MTAPLSERAAAALEDAFADAVKGRFDVLCGNIAGGMAFDEALDKFEKALVQLKAAHQRGGVVVSTVFAP